MLKVTLSVTKLHGTTESTRDITFDAASIGIEDWFEKGTQNKTPNACKIISNGECYKANISRSDLERHLEENGVKIIRAKK